METKTADTAAGVIQVIEEAFSPARGSTKMWIGTLSDGRFAVASRWQYEVVTKDRSKADKVFKRLTKASA